MLKRFRRHLNPSMVVALIALFAALGGGYATAFSGSGTLQKGSELGISSPPETIRTLTGIGSIRADCQSNEAVRIFFANNSGETLTAMGVQVNGGVVAQRGDNVGPNNVLTLFNAGDSANEMDLHISPQDGTKRPQADVHVTVNETSMCSTSTVRVLALNTEQ